METWSKWIYCRNIFGQEETAWLIGVQASGAVRYEEKGFLEASYLGLLRTWNMIDYTITGIKKIVIRDTPTEYRVVDVQKEWVEEDDSLPADN